MQDAGPSHVQQKGTEAKKQRHMANLSTRRDQTRLEGKKRKVAAAQRTRVHRQGRVHRGDSMLTDPTRCDLSPHRLPTTHF